MTQIKNENRYGMNRIKGIYKIWSIGAVPKIKVSFETVNISHFKEQSPL
jgi:hypothetical protein